MPKYRADKNWWPTPLTHVPTINFLADEMVTVAEFSSGAKPESTRNVCLVLLDLCAANRLVENTNLIFSYMPWNQLVIESNGAMIEHLTTRWEGGTNTYIQVPSNEFLSFFGLVPRSVDSTIYWDDLSKPIHGVVCAEMVSKYDFLTTTKAVIQIRRDYLLRYANETNRAIVALWYEWNSSEDINENEQPHNESEFGEFLLPGRMVDLRRYGSNTISAEFWGCREVYFPDTSPSLTHLQENKLSLRWPGITQPVSKDNYKAMRLQGSLVYVNDKVLDRYEEHPETYTVNPETGCVSYTNQWSVSYCHRIGRDLIALEVKKLYERAPIEEIQHWHKYAITPPSNPQHNVKNVATRAKRIVFGLHELGTVICNLYANSIGENLGTKNIIGQNTDALPKTMWYYHDSIRPITRRIPIDMGKDAFLHRCVSLTKLVIEGFCKRNLLRLLMHWGINKEDISRYASLKLLDQILQLAIIANDEGLSLIHDHKAILAQYEEKQNTIKNGKYLPSPVSFLFTLYDIRTKHSAHPGGKYDDLLSLLNIKEAHVKSGWGAQMDVIYDQIGDSLENSAKIIFNALDNADIKS